MDQEHPVVMDDLLQEMIDPAPAHHDAPRRRRLWSTVAIVGLAALGATSLTTGALFTDRDSSGTSITSGSVDLTAGELTYDVPLAQNLLPGARLATPVLVSNSGSLAFQYAISAMATDSAGPAADEPDLADPVTPGNLSSRLRLTVRDVGANGGTLTSTAAAAAAGCNAAGVDGLPSLGTTTAAPGFGIPTADFGTVVGTPGVVTSATDPNPNQALAAQTSRWLCIDVEFDVDADNACQNRTATLALRFDAHQLSADTAVTDPSGLPAGS